MYLSTQDQLEDFCRQIEGEKVIAVDTEFLREKTYYPKLCLVQVGAAELTAAIPNGVQAMSQEIPGLVESSMNLGILALAEDGLHLTVSVRSNNNGEKEVMRRRLAGIAGQFGADFSTRG